MAIVRGVLMVKCQSCHREHEFLPDNTGFESSETHKRGQLDETAYFWGKDVDCDCGNKINIDYKVWEYPTGDFNADDLKVNGGNVLKKFDYDFEREPDFYE
jgi:hypothetical protein